MCLPTPRGLDWPGALGNIVGDPKATIFFDFRVFSMRQLMTKSNWSATDSFGNRFAANRKCIQKGIYRDHYLVRRTRTCFGERKKAVIVW